MAKLNKKFSLSFYLFQPVFLLVVILVFSSFNQPKPKSYGITRVVIDAGHGGHDSGCLGKKSKEKDIALGIALKLGQYINDKFPDVKVIYTRKSDVFVELFERANIANNAKADLFICIHCNSACYYDKKKRKDVCNTETNGVETWVMGLQKSEANLEVAKRENEVVLLEKDYSKQYDGFDPNSPEANIIFSLYQNTYLDQSLRMASFVQQEMKGKGLESRGIKQAGFLVLYKTTMPSILIETGFLSNPDEEKYLSGSKGQEESASAIFRAFKSYKQSVESTKTSIAAPENSDSDDKSENDSAPETKRVAPKNKDVQSADVSESKQVLWAVQFYASPSKISKKSSKFEGVKDVKEELENKVFKYTSGQFEKQEDAIVLQSKLRKSGFKDAFVVGYYNDKKVSFKEATELSKGK